MRLNPKTAFLLSLVSGFLAFILISQMLKNATKPQAVIDIVIAADDLHVGNVITEEKIKMAPAPSGISIETAFRETDMVVGSMLRNSIRAGKPILTFDIANEEEDIFALIPEGYRASTLPVHLPKEVVDLLKFGSRVDVLYTDTSSEVLETSTIMRNVLVMKVSGNSTTGGAMIAGQDVYVTLAVPPQAVETLSYVMRKGKLDLSILPLGSQNVEEAYISMKELLDAHEEIVNPTPIKIFHEVEIIKGTKKQMVEL